VSSSRSRPTHERGVDVHGELLASKRRGEGRQCRTGGAPTDEHRGRALETVAVTEFDIAALAFEQVLRVLEEADFVHLNRNSAGEVTGLTESVPMYHDLYQDLGGRWRARKPKQRLAVVDRLASGSVPVGVLAPTSTRGTPAAPIG
jgi:hypothetical protein